MTRKPFLSLVVCMCACTGAASGSGDLVVLVEAEDTIVDGLDPGDEVENIRDGWQARFNRYDVAIGDVDLHLSSDHETVAEAPEVWVVDLAQIPAAGLPLWDLPGLAAGRWEFAFRTAGAAEAERHDSVPAADFEAMLAEDLTYFIEGTLTQSGGRSCPPPSLATVPEGTASVGTNAAGHACYANPSLTFVLGAAAPASYGPCEIDGVAGIAIARGGTQTVAITIHGDHLFFNGFPEGDEGGTMRLAQWLADCDLNLDGTVEVSELRSIVPSDLAEIDDRFQLGGSPVTPLANMWTYVGAQLRTQGHFQGEGECALDGTPHAHD
jgi:hypothetical protein